MSELFLKRNSKKYVSSTEAARLFNVTNDYVARLARNGRLSGIIENGTWYVEEDALKSFFSGRKEQRNTVAPIASKTVSSREAAKVYRVTHDYISRLCRQGKLRGVLEGRNWVVEVGSLEEFFKKPYPSAAPAADAPVFVPVAMPAYTPKKQRTNIFWKLAPGVAALLLFCALGASAMVAANHSEGQGASVFSALHDLFFGAGVSQNNSVTLQTASNPSETTVVYASPSQSQQTVVQNITQPIVDRTVVETESGITQSDLDTQLNALSNSLKQLIYATNSVPNSLPATGGYTNEIAVSQDIDQLTGTTLSNVTVHGVSGLTVADIPALDYLSTAGGTVSGNVVVGGTASTSDITISSLGSSGTNCVQADALGHLTTTGSACGSGSGSGSAPFGQTLEITPQGYLAPTTTVTLLATGGLISQGSTTINTLNLGNALAVAFGGTGTSTAPSYGQLLLGDNNGNYELVSTSSLGITAGSNYTFSYPLTNSANTISLGFGTTTANSFSQLQTLSNLLVTGSTTLQNFTAVNATTSQATTTNLAITGVTSTLLKTLSNGAVVAAQAGVDYQAAGNYATFGYLFPGNATSTNITFSGGITGDVTGNLSGNAGTVTNGVYTTTFGTLFDNRLSASSSISGITTLPNLSLPYSQLTGTPATFGYLFPGNATSTQLAFNGGLTAAGATSTSLAVTGSSTINLLNLSTALAVSSGGTGSTTLGGLLTGSGTGAVTSATVNAPLSFSGNTLSIQQATASQSGYLSGADFTTFTDKISSTSLSGTYPVQYNSSTGVISLGFGTSTSNTWGGTQTFTNTPVLGTLSGLVGSNNGTLYQIATSTNFVTSLSAGTGIALSGSTGSVTVTNTIGYPFPSNATTTQLAFNGGLTANGATSTSLAVTGSTTISSVLNSLFANNLGSTTLSGNTLLSQATTTNLAITGVTGSLLKTLSDGAVAAAVAGADYATPSQAAFEFTPDNTFATGANSTSTLIGFTNGLYSLASSTIGNGTQAGGLTISGGATTTGNINLTTANSTITGNTGLTLQETGDQYGTVSLSLENRTGANGAVFKDPSLDLVDFGFIGSSGAQQNIRFEHRSGNIAGAGNVAGGEFQIGPPPPNNIVTANVIIGAGTTAVLSDFFGIGTTSPFAQLSLIATSTTGVRSPTTLFAIASTTGGNSTTTLFSISNTGNSLLSGTASSTGLTVSNLGGGAGLCLTVNSSGVLSTQSCSTGGFGYLFPSNATTTQLAFNGGLTATNISGHTLAVGGTSTTTIDSAGNLLVQGGTSAGTSLDVNGTANALYYNVAGSQFIDNAKNANVNSISVDGGYAVIDSAGVITSNATAASTFPYASTTAITATTASTTNLTISGVGGSLLKTLSNGVVVAAVPGTDYLTSANIFGYPFPNNATTTGLLLLASTTIGDGTQTGGLTISGDATTTGSAYFGGGAYFAGNVGIGVANPPDVLDVSTTSGPTIISAINSVAGAASYATLSSRSRDPWSGEAAWGSNTVLNDTNDPYLLRENNTLSGWGIVGFNQSSPWEDQDFFDIDYINPDGTATSTRLSIDYQGDVNVGVSLNTPALTVGSLDGPLYAQAGVVSATSSLSTNYLSGILGTINNTPFNARDTINISAASSTLLSDSNTFLGSNTFNGSTTLVNATSSTFAITGVTSSLLKTDTNGNVIPAVAGTDYLTSANIFGYPFPNNATSTLIGFGGGLISSASSTFTGTLNAGTLNLQNLSNVVLAVNGSGQVIATSSIGINNLTGTLGVANGGTGSTTLGGLLTGSGTGAVTSAVVNAPLSFSGNTLSIQQATASQSGYLSGADFTTFQNKISSTSLSSANGYLTYSAATGVFTASTSPTYTNATSTNFAIGVTSSVLKTNALGQLVAAVAGTDYSNFGYLFPNNATTTGLGIYASSTIGNGTQAGGLTISGGATTTGSLNIVSPNGLLINGIAAVQGSTTLNNYYFGGATTTALDNGTYNYAIGQGAMEFATSSSVLGNFAAGYEALMGSSTAGNIPSGDVALGYQTLFANTSGYNNNALGLAALKQNTTGFNNNAIGGDALWANTTGFNNNAIGPQAMDINTTGSENSAIGDNALVGNTTGSYNVALGDNALLQNNGSNNIGIGHQAGREVTSGYSDITIGDDSTAVAGPSTGFGDISIGSNAFFQNPAANRQLNIGNILFGTVPATTTNFVLPTTGSIGIGTTSPFAEFAIGANNGSSQTTLFAIGSSTASATTTLFSISNTGSTTVANGVNITSGCYATNGTCLSASSLGADTFGYLFPSNATTTGLLLLASTTIGNGTQAGGLTISGGATTTGSAYFAGDVAIGTTSPFAQLSVFAGSNYASDSASTLFAIGSSSAGLATTTLFQINNDGSFAFTGPNAQSFVMKSTGTTINTQFTLQSSGSTDASFQASQISLTPGGSGSAAAPNVQYLTSNPCCALTANTEHNQILFNFDNGLEDHVNGNIAVERVFNVATPLEEMNTFNQQSNFGQLATEGIEGPPITSKNATTTNAYTLLIGSSTPSVMLNASTTNSYGLGIWTTGGAVNTYAATFNGGNVGIGTTSPFSDLAIQANNGDLNTTLFAIGSSTANATTTLFSVDNEGDFSAAGTASTTALTISSLGSSAGQCLTTNASGSVTSTSCGSGGFFSWTPTSSFGTAANATSTLIGFNAGLYSLASTTIGNGNQAGGLTISGGATTTGNAYFAGNLNIGTTTLGNFDEPATPVTIVGSTTIIDTGSNMIWKPANEQTTYGLRVGADTTQSGILIQEAPGGTSGQEDLGIYNRFGTQIFGVSSSNINFGQFVNLPDGIDTGTFNFPAGGDGLDKSSLTSNNASSPAVLIYDQDNYGTPRTAPLMRFAINDPGNSGNPSSLNTSVGGISDLLGSTTNSLGLAFDSYSSTTASFVENFRILANNTMGIGSTSPFAQLAIQANNGSTNTTLFAIGSSTASATSTLFSISNTGSTTIANGVNITGGCFALNGTCLSTTGGSSFGYLFPNNATTTSLLLLASTTIGNGTQTGGLTISGGATTTGNAYTKGSSSASYFNATSPTGYLINGISAAIGSTTTDNFDFAGATSSAVDQGSYNIALGPQALANATSSLVQLNFAAGYQALMGTTTAENDAEGDNAIGYQTLFSNSTGSYDNAIGVQALYSNTSGTFNNAIGVSALYSNTTGNQNNAVGDDSLQYNTNGLGNNAFGTDALGLNTSGNDNSAFGVNALVQNNIGSDNAALGYYAGYNNTSGYNNVFIGSTPDNGGSNIETGFNDIMIGYDAVGTSNSVSNFLNVGNLLFANLPATSTYAGNQLKLPTTGGIGIGTSSPFAEFAIGANNGSTQTTLFAIGSSTASATTTLFSVSNTGSTTIANGVNITAGCFAINGTCISTGGASFSYLFPNNATTTGLGIYASSTIGNGAQAGGLTISGGATTTGNAYFAGNVGIGTSTPFALLTVGGGNIYSPDSTLFAIASSTNTATSTFLTIDKNGYLSIGAGQGTTTTTISPGNTISMGNSGVFTVDASSSITTISNLSVGNLVFDTDAGVVNLSDIPLDSNAATGTPESQSINIGGSPIFTVFGLSSGQGTSTNQAVGIGTTSPEATLTVVGAICAARPAGSQTSACGTTAGEIFANSSSLSAGVDVAEEYPVSDNSLAPGDIVTFDPSNPQAIERATTTNDFLGIVSTNPALTLGDTASTSRPVALVGRVPVNINLDGGAINVGDPITLSSVPGVGAKATTTTEVVGISLGSYSGTGTSTVVVFIKPELWFASSSQSGILSQFSSASASFQNALSSALSALGDLTQNGVRELGTAVHASVGVFGSVFAQTITVDTVEAQKLCLGNTCITESQLQALLNQQSQNNSFNNSSSNSSSSTTTPSVPPTITINGNNPATITVDDTYADLGATITDTSPGQAGDTNLGYETYVNGIPAQSISLDTSTTTTYSIDYVATDSAGLTATSTREVIVSAATSTTP